MHLFSSVCRENKKLFVYIQELFILKRKQNKTKRKVILVCNLQFAFFNLQSKKDKDSVVLVALEAGTEDGGRKGKAGRRGLQGCSCLVMIIR